MSVERRDAMLAAVESEDDGREQLRLVVKGYVDGGVDPDLLLEDLSQISGLVAPEIEDDVLDVMDLLTGWCASSARLVPPKPRTDA
jgi:hypothetical protein